MDYRPSQGSAADAMNVLITADVGAGEIPKPAVAEVESGLDDTYVHAADVSGLSAPQKYLTARTRLE